MAARRSTRPLGQRGEEIAARFLARRGLTILARNLRSRLGEIDLVGREGTTLVFVEVKARQTARGDPPQAAVDGRKRARLARLALAFLTRHGLGEPRCRFDVVAVTLEGSEGGAQVEHFPGAFLVDGWGR
jgi:putative endonuclease